MATLVRGVATSESLRLQEDMLDTTAGNFLDGFADIEQFRKVSLALLRKTSHVGFRSRSVLEGKKT